MQVLIGLRGSHFCGGEAATLQLLALQLQLQRLTQFPVNSCTSELWTGAVMDHL